MKRIGRLYGVGLGPGDPELVSLKAARVLSEVPVIFVPKGGRESRALSIVKGVVGEEKEIVELSFPMLEEDEGRWEEAASAIWGRLSRGEDCAFAVEGDPLLYSTFVPLIAFFQRRFPQVKIKVISGITSLSAAAASIPLPLARKEERLAILPAIYEKDDLEEILKKFDTVAFFKVHRSLERILNLLERIGFSGSCFLVEEATTKEEKVIGDIEEMKKARPGYFSLLLVKRSK
ncbi:precorrin-2 C(20)-methyltransferase [Candidatus Poribacteria bacterium]|nr:precorrin-2 C(20)-methyltransferase [Candidatus Poribacteria bacterium]